MSDVTSLLSQIESGDTSKSEQILPLVYDELRKLAAAKLAQEKPGQTLQATALVHEAWLRLLGTEKTGGWTGRGHFFAAAAEAMRRILIDQARRKASIKAGGRQQRIPLEQAEPEIQGPTLDLIALDLAMDKLAIHDARAACVVKLRYFAGLTMGQTADALGVSIATAENDWAYAKSWLRLNIIGYDDQ